MQAELVGQRPTPAPSGPPSRPKQLATIQASPRLVLNSTPAIKLRAPVPLASDGSASDSSVRWAIVNGLGGREQVVQQAGSLAPASTSPRQLASHAVALWCIGGQLVRGKHRELVPLTASSAVPRAVIIM